jgi:hypothetical protein
MVLDLDFTLMKTFSIIPAMPSASVSEVRPPIRSGRPTIDARARSNTLSSIGRTWYFAASVMNRACICASFSGCFAARSVVRLKSARVSYSSQTSLCSGLRGFCSHGARWMVRANQPS